MKKILLILAVMLFFNLNSYSQATFTTGAIGVDVNEYGKIELFNADSIYQLWRTSILVGTSSSSVFDYQNDADNEEATILVSNPALSDYEIYGAFNNAYSSAPPDVIVKLNAYGWNNGGYIIVKFNVKNNETNQMNAMAGLDIIPYIDEEDGYDTVSYNSANGVIRMHRGNQTNIGMKLLSSSLLSLYSFEYYDGYYVDSSYWSWMNYGSLQPLYASNTGDGSVTITSQNPVTIGPGESFDLYYAMALGTDEQTMLNNIAAAEVKYQTLITSIDDNKLSANEFMLGQNSPNPFDNSTTINYQLPDAGFVSLKVYNVIGTEVASLVSSNQSKGPHTIQYNAQGLTSGVYYYTLRFGNQVKSNKMFVIK